MPRIRVPCSALSCSVGVVGRIATLFVVVDVDVDLWIFFLDFHLLIWNLESSRLPSASVERAWSGRTI